MGEISGSFPRVANMFWNKNVLEYCSRKLKAMPLVGNDIMNEQHRPPYHHHRDMHPWNAKLIVLQ